MRFLLPSLMFLAMGCAQAPSSVDPGEVQAFLDAFRESAASGDAARIAGHYTEDVVILEDGRVAYEGREAVRAAIAAFPAQGGTSLRFTDTRITPVGAGAALVQTLFSQSFEEAGFSYSGAISLLAVRSELGWMIHRSHTSTARSQQDWVGDE